MVTREDMLAKMVCQGCVAAAYDPARCDVLRFERESPGIAEKWPHGVCRWWRERLRCP